MKLTADELVALGSLLKAGAEEEPEDKEEKKSKRKKKNPHDDLRWTGAYPDYSRSLVSQAKRSPVRSGLKRGLGTGAVGAVLAALLARTVTDKPGAIGGAALAGGLVGGGTGYASGHQEALSDYTKLLFLRRLGVGRPGEFEALLRYPGAAESALEPERI